MSVAILAIESPWWSPRENTGQASSIPFFEGIVKYSNDTCNAINLYHSSFFDSSSLGHALQHLVQTSEQYQILWIGAHGDGERIANGTIKKATEVIREKGRKIKGMILSSCWGGENQSIGQALGSTLDDNLKEVYGPNWVLAYKHSVYWFESALFEVAILTNAARRYMRSGINSREAIIDMIASAAKAFHIDSAFGYDRSNRPVSLANCLSLWTRPQGAQIATDNTQDLIKAIERYQRS